MTFGDSQIYQAPRSFWYERLEKWAAPRTVDEWLVEEANVRGFWGAAGAEIPNREPDSRLTLEEIVIGLIAPQASLDGRILKLVVRILQHGKVNLERLLFIAKRAKAESALHWIARLVPEEEMSSEIRILQEAVPRGYHPLQYRYSPERLLTRRATKADLWRTPRN